MRYLRRRLVLIYAASLFEHPARAAVWLLVVLTRPRRR